MSPAQPPHWHAYARTSPPDFEADDPAGTPNCRDWWLARPAYEVVATHYDARTAAQWMAREMSRHRPFCRDAPYGWRESRGSVPADLTGWPQEMACAHYLDEAGRWVLRILAPCTGPVPCPTGKE